MRDTWERSVPARSGRRLMGMLWVLLLALWPASAVAADLSELEELIDEARLTFARFVGSPNMNWFRDRVREARAVFIAPRMVKGGYFFGGSWGTGVLLVKDEATHQWSEPAFYTLVGTSFGLQIGAHRLELVALALNESEAAAMLDGTFVLKASGTLAAGAVGGGLGGGLEPRAGAGLVYVVDATGAYAGVSIGGTLILADNGANELYYGRPVKPSELARRVVGNWYSERLRRAIIKATDEEGTPKE
jgi:SH3 domain-containing YSC84-like protein 1